MEECSICCETYNKVKHSKVTCPTCDVSFCRTCVQRYLLETQNDPHCMSCRTAWNREFVDAACTKVFRTKPLKNHRENILFNRQLALLPQTQGAVESYTESKRLKDEVADMDARISELCRARRRADADMHAHTAIWKGWAEGETQQRREFVRRCPCDGCKGFLSTAWKCGVCSKHICKDCNEEKVDGEEHECKPENVETVKLLNKDTKGCPNCGTLIFKISGCSQMWCPDCHTAFNWNTMSIEKGVIHNPHFFEFQRAQERGGGGRNLADIPCGGLPTTRELYSLSRNRGGVVPEPVVDHLTRVVMRVQHLEYYEIPLIQHGAGKNWIEERVRYMVDEMSEGEFKMNLQRHEKARAKGQDLVEIMRMVINVVSDLLRQLVVDSPNYAEYMAEMNRLREYANTSFSGIGARYTNKSYLLCTDWSTMRI